MGQKPGLQAVLGFHFGYKLGITFFGDGRYKNPRLISV